MTRDELIHYRDEFQAVYLRHSGKTKRFSIPAVLLILAAVVLFFTAAGIYGGDKKQGYYVMTVISICLLAAGLVFLGFWIYHGITASVNKKHRDELSYELNHITMQHLDTTEKVFPYIN